MKRNCAGPETELGQEPSASSSEAIDNLSDPSAHGTFWLNLGDSYSTQRTGIAVSLRLLGKEWGRRRGAGDRGFEEETLGVLKPGAHVLVFGVAPPGVQHRGRRLRDRGYARLVLGQRFPQKPRHRKRKLLGGPDTGPALKTAWEPACWLESQDTRDNAGEGGGTGQLEPATEIRSPARKSRNFPKGDYGDRGRISGAPLIVRRTPIRARHLRVSRYRHQQWHELRPRLLHESPAACDSSPFQTVRKDRAKRYEKG